MAFQSEGEKKLHILIIEDEPSIRMTLKIVIENTVKGSIVSTAENGLKALSFLSNGLLCDLLICDIMMPEIDGAKLITHLVDNEEFRNIKVIILTALDDGQLSELLTLPSVIGKITKPINPMTLSSRIMKFIEISENKLS